MSNGLIQATSQGIAGTYKDGTIKVVITIEPTDAAEAFAILGTPGAPLVIGQLTQEAAQASLREQAAESEPEMKGGQLAKWAGILSNDPDFLGWAEIHDLALWMKCMDRADDKTKQGDSFSLEGVCADFIRRKCGVKSRRELDHNRQAGLTFREEIMAPFHQWREQQ